MLEQQIEKLVFSRKEAAQALGVCLTTLDHLIEGGELKAKRIGFRRVIAKDELRNFLGVEK